MFVKFTETLPSVSLRVRVDLSEILGYRDWVSLEFEAAPGTLLFLRNGANVVVDVPVEYFDKYFNAAEPYPSVADWAIDL